MTSPTHPDPFGEPGLLIPAEYHQRLAELGSQPLDTVLEFVVRDVLASRLNTVGSLTGCIADVACEIVAELRRRGFTVTPIVEQPTDSSQGRDL